MTHQQIAAELGVSRKTLRPVLEQLAMENLIERVKGKGTFIRDAEESRTKILVLNDEQDISNPFHYIFPGVQIGAETLNVNLELCSSPSILSQSEDKSATRILKCGFQGSPIISMETSRSSRYSEKQDCPFFCPMQ